MDNSINLNECSKNDIENIFKIIVENKMNIEKEKSYVIFESEDDLITMYQKLAAIQDDNVVNNDKPKKNPGMIKCH